jgi:hypothetical protein
MEGFECEDYNGQFRFAQEVLGPWQRTDIRFVTPPLLGSSLRSWLG